MVAAARAAGEVGAQGRSFVRFDVYAYAAGTRDMRICGRIMTAPEHRRKALGSAMLMAAQRAKRSCSKLELLVATADGRPLVRLGDRLRKVDLAPEPGLAAMILAEPTKVGVVIRDLSEISDAPGKTGAGG